MLIVIFYIDIELYIKVHGHKGAVLLEIGVRKCNPPDFRPFIPNDVGAIRLLVNRLYILNFHLNVLRC